MNWFDSYQKKSADVMVNRPFHRRLIFSSLLKEFSHTHTHNTLSLFYIIGR